MKKIDIIETMFPTKDDSRYSDNAIFFNGKRYISSVEYDSIHTKGWISFDSRGRRVGLFNSDLTQKIDK